MADLNVVTENNESYFLHDHTTDSSGDHKVRFNTHNNFLDKDIQIKITTPASEIPASSLSITDNTAQLDMGSANEGYYYPTNTLTGTVTPSQAGWVTTSPKTVSQNNVKVGKVAQSTLSASTVTPGASAQTVTIGPGYYDTNRTVTVEANSAGPKATVVSGDPTHGALTTAYNGTNDNFDITGTITVAAPTVSEDGFISSTLGTKTGNSGNIASSLNKITGTVTVSGDLTQKPDITKQNINISGVTNAANGEATTTTPSSGVYVAVQSAAKTGNISANPGVTSAGYGTADHNGLTGTTVAAGAAASDLTYIPIFEADPSFTGGDLSTSSDTNTVASAPAVVIASSGSFKDSTDYGVTSIQPQGTDGTNYLTIDGSGTPTDGTVTSSWAVGRAALNYTAIDGWVSKSSSDVASSADSTTGGQSVTVTPTVTDNFNPLYIPVVSVSCAGGELTPTNYSKTDLAVTVAEASTADRNIANYSVGAKDTTNYPYYIKVQGDTPAVSGSTTVNRAAVTVTNGAGAIAANNATQGIAANSESASVSVNAATGSTYVGLAEATFNTNGGTITVATAGYIPAQATVATLANASLANEATSQVEYTDISSTAPILVSGDYLYINGGYIANSKVSLAKLVPDSLNQATFASAGYILAGYGAWDADGAQITGTIPTYTGSYTVVS